jgi:hypothetical protein
MARPRGPTSGAPLTRSSAAWFGIVVPGTLALSAVPSPGTFSIAQQLTKVRIQRFSVRS